MIKKQANVIFIISDQHKADMCGFQNHPLVKTPHLDRLAARGTVFDRAYCNSPICGPSRISMMTGRFLHETEMWCNGVPWNGEQTTWAKRLEESGINTASFGKMDVAGEYDSVGFGTFKELIPREAFKPYPLMEPRRYDLPDFSFGKDESSFERWFISGITREEAVEYWGKDPGPDQLTADGLYKGAFGHYNHDRITTKEALNYIRSREKNQPFTLHVGLLQPHWPFVCPREYFDLYHLDDIELPFDFTRPNLNLPPAIRHYQKTHNDFQEVASEEHMKRITASYYGMITAMDACVGEIIDEVERQGLADDTYIIYTSDHGEALGEHGLFNKLTPFENSTRIPLLMSGPGLPKGKRESSLVSLVDLYPTLLELYRVEQNCREKKELKGASWLPLLKGKEKDRKDYIFSEYEGIFFYSKWFMVVKGDYKYIYYEGDSFSLYNLKEDPREMNDLSKEEGYEEIVREYREILWNICDPEKTALKAKKDLGFKNDK